MSMENKSNSESLVDKLKTLQLINNLRMAGIEVPENLDPSEYSTLVEKWVEKVADFEKFKEETEEEFKNFVLYGKSETRI